MCTIRHATRRRQSKTQRPVLLDGGVGRPRPRLACLICQSFDLAFAVMARSAPHFWLNRGSGDLPQTAANVALEGQGPVWLSVISQSVCLYVNFCYKEAIRALIALRFRIYIYAQ